MGTKLAAANSMKSFSIYYPVLAFDSQDETSYAMQRHYIDSCFRRCFNQAWCWKSKLTKAVA